ncbi:Aldo/keto reductase [Pseudovirgaria hyperparasitica]|uniref:Aldo/keto reductase n=1 Tax=Pseudovirgaria hyperparasitica TaxID=470096 RepID=A0A6A6VYY6_9PEZI|nr:Aldo/keto reductase [Pseudovirgaria hyperparasitica]KAF2755445.1 Aldo/keto reductase [Pseudovirgaria hyperparasitica]
MPPSPPLTNTSTASLLSGHKMPLLGYGVYKTPAQDTAVAVHHALSHSYRHIDCAVAYANEAAAAEALHNSGIPRSQLFFTSKIPPDKTSYAGARQSVAETLERTGLGYVDLYLVHAPYGGREGRLGAWAGLVEAVRAGQVRSIGVSNYGVRHLEELEAYMREREAAEGSGAGGVLSVNQVELHPWLGRREIVEWCQRRGVVVQAYAPLVRATRNEEPVLVRLAERYGKTPSQVLVRWSLQKGFVPLPKSVNKERIEENAGVFGWEISDEDMETLELDCYEPCAWDPTVITD